jgi:hypothetical protein
MEHLLQLFDSEESLAGAVAGFLHEGHQAGDQLLVCITPLHWAAVASELRSRGVETATLVASGQLTLRDASLLVQQIMRNGQPDPARFDEVIGELVRELAAGTSLRIYGELVDVLAERGEFRNAELLEHLWNQLREETPFTLFCGYSAVHFGDPRSTDALRSIGLTHSGVRTNAADALATFLLGRVSTRGTSAESPRRPTKSPAPASKESAP